MRYRGDHVNTSRRGPFARTLEVSLSAVVSEEGEIVLWMELVYFRLVVV